MSVQVCDEIQNPGQKSFKLNHFSFVKLLKTTAVEIWAIQGMQGNLTETSCFSKRMKQYLSIKIFKIFIIYIKILIFSSFFFPPPHII